MRSPLAWGILCLLALVWGSSFILMKMGLESFSPLNVAAIRLVMAALVLVPLIVFHPKRPSRKELLAITFIGVFGNAIPAFLFPYAEQEINTGTAGVLNALSPLYALIFGVFLFGSKTTTRQVIGLVIGFGGAMWLTLGGDGTFELNEKLWYPGAVMLATIFYGVSVNIMKHYLNDTPPVIATGYGISIASIPYLIYLIAQPDFWAQFAETSFTAPAPNPWVAFGYLSILGIIGTALSLLLFYRLIQMTDAIFGASVTYLIPIVAMIWSLAIGEHYNTGQFLGMGVILMGVYLANSAGNTKPKRIVPSPEDKATLPTPTAHTQTKP